MSELVIDVTGIVKKFSGRTVVDRLSLKVRRGEIFGFLGPNGSGKTTFIRMLCGLLTPDAGEGKCLGYNILKDQNIIRRHAGYMTQKFSFYEDLTVRENLDFIARIYDVPDRKKSIIETMEKLNFSSRANQLAGSLSGGWKQRLALAACLLHKPELLLLDEPTAGVDPKARREFWDEVHKLASEENMTVLITTHYMDEAERCTRLAYIAYGKLLAEGTLAEVISSSGLYTWSVSAPQKELPAMIRKLQADKAVLQAAPFGNTLHVSGTDKSATENAIKTVCAGVQELSVEEIESGLEDVFIHLMDKGKDNFQ